MSVAITTHYVIQQHTPQECLTDCVDLLNATRDHLSTEDRFRWLYLDNPDGAAVVWILRKRGSSEALGFTATLPRRMLVQGAIRRGWIGADFSILPAYRTLGLAVKLRRAAREAIDQGAADFLYAHPNDRMAAIHRQAGHQPIGQMIRLAKPISLRPFLEEWTSSPRLARLAAQVGDPCRSWLERLTLPPAGLVLRDQTLSAIGPQYDELFWRAATEHPGIIGIRDATYLRWRYAANPLYQTHLLAAEDAGRLAGYALYVVEGDEVHIKDLFPMQQPSVVGALLHELSLRGYQHGWRSLSITLLESNPLCQVLTRVGFRLRAERSTMFGYCPSQHPWSPLVYDQHAWWLSVGDRDV